MIKLNCQSTKNTCFQATAHLKRFFELCQSTPKQAKNDFFFKTVEGNDTTKLPKHRKNPFPATAHLKWFLMSPMKGKN